MTTGRMSISAGGMNKSCGFWFIVRYADNDSTEPSGYITQDAVKVPIPGPESSVRLRL